MAKNNCNAIIKFLILPRHDQRRPYVWRRKGARILCIAPFCVKHCVWMWCGCCFCYPCDGPTPLGVNESEEIMQILLSAPRHPLYETKNPVETLGGAEKRQEAHVGSSAINTCKTSEPWKALAFLDFYLETCRTLLHRASKKYVFDS